MRVRIFLPDPGASWHMTESGPPNQDGCCQKRGRLQTASARRRVGVNPWHCRRGGTKAQPWRHWAGLMLELRSWRIPVNLLAFLSKEHGKAPQSRDRTLYEMSRENRPVCVVPHTLCESIPQNCKSCHGLILACVLELPMCLQQKRLLWLPRVWLSSCMRHQASAWPPLKSASLGECL